MISYASSSSSSSSSSTSSSIRVSKGYDIFVSFRGEDTRTGFTSHLYEALTRKRIRTYEDDKSLETGSFIATELLRAIEVSKFAIVVLSRNFATSKWCLGEIVKIVDCMELGKLVVIPVFYHVSPSDVRHQRGCYVQGFTNHEENPEIPLQMVETWRAAFKKLGAISGLHVTQDRKESEVVNEIVKRVLTGLQVTLPTSLPDGLVGIESRLNEMKRILNMESSEVRFIGICGMSGVGKTTLAEVVYQAIQKEFQESSFIENIKDISKEHDRDLCKFQQKILDDILKGESIPVRSVIDGQTLLKTKLRDLKVIIVLDDVNHAEQLTYLAGGREWFGNGSRIIITTTNTDLLNPPKIDATYVCEELEGDEALSLFCQSAFGGHSTNGYENLSKDIVKLAGGLPLALNVYGSLLCGKEERYWKEILKKFQENPHKKVVERLEIGYARLDKNEQDTFRYIACFLKGRDKDLVKDILTDIGLYPECGITDLINKFLITFDYEDRVWMHDLLQQMSWEILRKDSERDNGKYIAIKRRQDIQYIFSSKPERMRTLEIINQEPYKVQEEVCFDDPTCFSMMMKLRFLRISNIGFSQGLDYLSNDLRILEWYGCSLKSLPPTFAPNHIFELDMCCSQLETLWDKDLDLPNLRSINLSFSTNLINIPNLTSTPKLLILNLEGCTKLKELHESVLFHKRLRYMNLNGCGLLQSLGGCNMEMDALEALHLSGCSNLEYIPEFGLNMKHLEHLYVDGTKIKKLPESLGKMCNLRKLDVSETSIEEISSSMYQLKRLRYLRVHGCTRLSPSRGFLYTNLDTISFIRELDLSYCNLSAVPDGIGLLCRVVKLDLSGNNFVLLPASISLLSNLRMLYLNNCKRLQSLPKLSIVNEETHYGLQIRFNYYISRGGTVLSRFRAPNNYGCPTVSCLNCPRLAENENGSYLVDKILNSYLQLRTKHWITPAAVFEIVGAGSNIPSSFKLMTFGKNVIHEGPWIGVVICAVIAVNQIDAFMDVKYTVTAHIHVGEKHSMIPIPINFLMANVENQLIFYWTDSDDLLRTVDSHQKNFSFSFSVDPGDGNVEVTKFGVRFIREGDIFELKRLEDSTSKVVHYLFESCFKEGRVQRNNWGKVISLPDRHSAINDLTIRTTNIFLNYRKRRYSLNDIHKIFNSLNEIAQEVLCECKEEWRHSEVITLVHDYYRISLETSQLYKYFVKLLKDVSCSWLSLKLALVQIVAKGRAGECTYQEMLQQLNDLDAPGCVRFSDFSIRSLAYICKQIVDFSGHLDLFIKEANKKFDLVMGLAKVSSVTLAGVFCILAAYVGNEKLLRKMKDATSYSMLLHLIKENRSVGQRRNHETGWYRRELRIWDFIDNAVLVRELKMKMARLTSFTNEGEEEMMTVIDKLHNKTGTLAKTIDDMSKHADKYSHDIGQVGVTLNQFIPGSKLQVALFGVHSVLVEDIVHLQQFNYIKDKLAQGNYGNSMCEAMGILYRAVSSLPTDLQWYIRACESAADSTLLSCHSTIIHDNTCSIIKFISVGRARSVDQIHKIVKRVIGNNLEAFMVLSECKEEWGRRSTPLFTMVSDYYHLCRETCQLYNDLVRLLKDVCDGWISVKLVLEQFVVKSRDDNYTLKHILLQFNGINIDPYGVMRQLSARIKEAAKGVCFSGNIFKSFADVCTHTVAFARLFNEEIQEFKSAKILAHVSSGLVAGVFSIMSALMVGYFVGEGRQDLESIWVHLIQGFSLRVSLRHFNQSLVIEEINAIHSLLHGLKLNPADFASFTEERKVAVIGHIISLMTKIDKMTVSIENMSRHAHKYNHDIMEAGTSLGISQSQISLPLKRKYSC
ncbi:disease resistance protein RPS4B-like [Rutidosis leptorrhynchoides]|uniref:disease resistance protein RPS4B-like n=1 Tax=Rutidosis leptorrhynchoides TaxID=125765 RepID=UPI003A99358F